MKLQETRAHGQISDIKKLLQHILGVAVFSRKV